MITNFEEITEDLSEKDRIYEPFVDKVLKGLNKPTKAPVIVYMINQAIATEYDYKEANFTEVRLRKFVNFYRSHGIIPICATSEGYFVSFENKVLESQIKSLEERAHGILLAARGLKKHLK